MKLSKEKIQSRKEQLMGMKKKPKMNTKEYHLWRQFCDKSKHFHDPDFVLKMKKKWKIRKKHNILKGATPEEVKKMILERPDSVSCYSSDPLEKVLGERCTTYRNKKLKIYDQEFEKLWNEKIAKNKIEFKRTRLLSLERPPVKTPRDYRWLTDFANVNNSFYDLELVQGVLEKWEALLSKQNLNHLINPDTEEFKGWISFCGSLHTLYKIDFAKRLLDKLKNFKIEFRKNQIRDLGKIPERNTSLFFWWRKFSYKKGTLRDPLFAREIKQATRLKKRKLKNS